MTKAALNRLIDVWQTEHREITFTRVSVGDTAPTDFASDWEPGRIEKHVLEWTARDYMFGRAMQPVAVARHVADLLASEETVSSTRIVPRYTEAGPPRSE